MAMIVKIKKLLRMSVPLLAALSIIALSGCGDTPPSGSTLTIATQGPIQPVSGGTSSNPDHGQYYRVTVKDADAKPLSRVRVDLQGIFTAGNGIEFNGAPGSAPVSLVSSVTTEDFGFVDFLISAPTYTFILLSSPINVTAVALATGGTLTVGTYQYCVTALDVQGETTCSSLASATTTTVNSSVAISWTAVTRAQNYNVYGRTTGEGLLGQVVSPTVTFTDTNSVIPGVAPPGANTTGTSSNTVTGTVMGTTGALSSSVGVAF